MDWQKFEKRFDALNAEQKDAVTTIDGPTLVIAGPGSGKTEILSLRVANILKERDVLPQSILCLTFTDSAQKNMRSRLFSLIGEVAYKIPIFTFHGFAVSIINKYPEYFYKGASFEPLDDVTKIKILENILAGQKKGSKLSSYHPKEGYIYLKAVESSISALKRAALLPDDLEKLLTENKKSYAKLNKQIGDLFSDRIQKETIEKAKKLIQKSKTPKSSLPYIEYQTIFSNSLSRVLSECEREQNTKALSKWKAAWLSKDEDGRSVLKNSLEIDKLSELVELYRRYQEELYQYGYFDFDDMLIDVILAIRKNKTLRFLLAETFEYVLIDEFQDTNDAQFSLVREIFKVSEEYLGKPNIMAVGDDDQAIYKFQGAEVSNMLNFLRLYSDTKLIVLKKNYRSTKEILSIARKVIIQGEERLENRIQQIEKNLIPMKSTDTPGITFKEFPTHIHELVYISKEIKKLKEEGIEYKDIAVIGRKHKDLVELIPYLHREKIPVNYERQIDVLSLQHIQEIVTMAIYAESLLGKTEREELLPTILSFEFWQIPRIEIWELSKKVESTRKHWIQVMKESGGTVARIADFLLEVAGQSKYKTCDEILDYLIGSHSESKGKADLPKSPFREYYFGETKLGENQDEYIHFLSSLRVFVETLRGYKSGKELSLSDLVEFVELHKKNNLAIYDRSKLIEKESSINLLTAHTAKGLEYKAVFIINCQEHVWFGRGMPRKISFPENLPIMPVGDDFDDKIRLFYVALTRAKEKIYFLSFATSELGKELPAIEFLREYTKEYHKDDNEVSLEIVHLSETKKTHFGHFNNSESAFLRALADDYVLNITHLNNFLDIEKKGPEYFFQVNFLRFPQAKTPDMAYGSAVHKAVQKLYIHLKQEGKIPSQKQFIKFFENDLFKQRLNNIEFQSYLTKGKETLKEYYEFNKKLFNKDDLVEFDFLHEHVHIGDALISGKIDRIERRDTYVDVVDLKTGKTLKSFEKYGSDFNKVLKYKRQLLFYKLLIEGSSTFKDLKVREGKLEFIEEKKSENRILAMNFNSEESERLKLLISVVYSKIKNLDFPNVSEYGTSEKEHVRFEDDLINGTI